MDNVDIITHEECCGCVACMDVCPQNAVSIKEDSLGFRYPSIDKNVCNACGLCLQKCPLMNRKIERGEEQTAYAARSADKKILMGSSSGGMGYEFGKWMLEQGGVVVGAAWDEELYVKHILVEKMEDLYKLQGSKYVQSQMDGIYGNIKAILKDGRRVLFTGTPCQVAALKNIVGENENLYTIDLICHGVPNQKMFRDYLKTLEGKYQGEIVAFNFRDKKRGWGTIGEVIIRQGKKMITIPAFKTEQSYYYYYYLRGTLSRESCYHCRFANSRRMGDITIGDYWGIENIHPEIRDVGQGVSLVICNTDKGKYIMDNLSNVELKATNFYEACRYNKQLAEPQKYNAVREELMKLYMEGGWKAVQNRFDKNIGFRRYVDRMKSYMPDGIMKRLKVIKRKVVR